MNEVKLLFKSWYQSHLFYLRGVVNKHSVLTYLSLAALSRPTRITETDVQRDANLLIKTEDHDIGLGGKLRSHCAKLSIIFAHSLVCLYVFGAFVHRRLQAVVLAG